MKKQQPNTPQSQSARLKDCRLLVFDFDGVFTDNKVYINEKGEEMVRCDRSDTYGLLELLELGVEVLILSTEMSNVVQHRAKKLGVPCINGAADKGKILASEMHKRNISAPQVVYVGNDVNDLPCFNLVGYSIAVADAHPLVRKQASYVTSASGGNGAVREVLELILLAKAM